MVCLPVVVVGVRPVVNVPWPLEVLVEGLRVDPATELAGVPVGREAEETRLLNDGEVPVELCLRPEVLNEGVLDPT